MNINFYNLKNDPKDLYKDLIDSGSGKNLVKTVSGNIKTDCPIDEPKIELEFDSDLIDANYMYIPTFKRYYFIKEKEVSTQRIFIVGFTDVLHTFRTGIDNMEVVVERQATPAKGNLYLTDKAYRTEQRHLIRTVPFQKNGSWAQFTPNAASIVLTTGGKS